MLAQLLEEVEQLSSEVDQLSNDMGRMLNGIDAMLNPRPGLALPCFGAETLVWTVQGAKRIDEVQIGELVLAFDLASQEVVNRSVVLVHHNRTTHFYEMQIAGQPIRATACHPFWVTEKQEWVKAKELKPGMRVRRLNGEFVPIESIRRQEVPESSSYNLSLKDVPTYFVGSGVLVQSETPVDYGLGGAGKVYIGTNPDYPGQIYIGESKLPIEEIELQHKMEAKIKLRGQLTPADKELFIFKWGMNIDVVASGLTRREYNLYLQEEFARYRELCGERVINHKRLEDEHLNQYAQKLKNPELRKAGFC